ncbi:MAG: iron-sulfur cluster assembly accessory protein [Candidatus Obscuribacterales bacterium]|jgi:iron-sulfur cluster assembly protein|nr:iron-sulfur cluster assembly accessory protein [Candidatus Obscuribacterales bacterium]
MSETTTEPQVINLTEAAAQEIKRLLADEPDKSGLRMEIRGGGCSGMSYGLRFDNAQEKDHVLEAFGVKVFIDPKSAIYLKGTHLDFQGGLNGQGFVIKNPQAKGSCGCGNSFSV